MVLSLVLATFLGVEPKCLDGPPSLSELDRFQIPRDVIQSNKRVAYTGWQESVQQADGWEGVNDRTSAAYRDLANYCYWSWSCWDQLEDALGYYHYDDMERREKLADLKRGLGDSAWFHGWMPPPYPPGVIPERD